MYSNNFIKTNWIEQRERVAQVNPELAEIIDEISPDNSYALYLAKYNYGDEIIQKAIFNIPDDEGKLIPITDNKIPNELRNDLDYNFLTNPVCLLLDNPIEVYLALKERTIPYGFVTKGNLLSTWMSLNKEGNQHPPFVWDISSGARSIFLLPKISDKESHQRLMNELGLKMQRPNRIRDQWYVFREVYSKLNCRNPWQTHLLYFSYKWFEHLDDAAWMRFENYLFRKAWAGSEYLRNQFINNLIYSLIQEERFNQLGPASRRPAYIDNAVRHLFGIGVGALPGFVPATDNSAAPVKEIIDVYNNIYKLKKYNPDIMHLGYFNLDVGTPVYYSLQYPTAAEFSPKSLVRSVALSEMNQIKSLLKTYEEQMLSNEMNIKNTSIFKLLNVAKFGFYHSSIKENHAGTIKSTAEFFEEDPRFKKTTDLKSPALFSSFLKGCIKISL